MDKKILLSTLWVFLTVNFIFCDVFTLMYSEELKQILSGNMGGVKIDQPFLLTFAILMEIPMLMIVLSRVLNDKINRVFNIVAGLLLTVIQGGSLLVGTPTLHYLFFSIVEISTTAFIVWYALNWRSRISG
ncbi:MAG: hypothetical protein IPL49_19190 [Saprospirales bacterium]|nr:hypothetical protein [Saprospirales bacterium]